MQTRPTIKEQLESYLDQLSELDQSLVLAYARRLATRPQGIPTQEFLDFFQQFPLTPEEKAEMRRIIEEIQQQ